MQRFNKVPYQLMGPVTEFVVFAGCLEKESQLTDVIKTKKRYKFSFKAVKPRIIKSCDEVKRRGLRDDRKCAGRLYRADRAEEECIKSKKRRHRADNGESLFQSVKSESIGH